jgi:hypothetical protein
MTKGELAKKLNIDRKTLNNWEKEKTELIRIINLGLQADQIIKESNQFNQKLKDIRKQANGGKLQLPKNEIDSMEILDYCNPADFDTVRIKRICNFLANVHIKDFRTTIVKALEEEELNDSGTYKYIEKQTSKKNLFSEFSKFIREMKNNEKIFTNKGYRIVQYVNDKLKIDFDEKDIDVINHILIMYEYYSQLFDIID